MKTTLSCGPFEVSLTLDSESWTATSESRCVQDGIYTLTTRFSSPETTPIPHIQFFWLEPSHDIVGRWTPANSRNRDRAMGYHGLYSLYSKIASCAPVVSMFSQSGNNRLTFAFSDAMNQSKIDCGFREETACIECVVDLFADSSAPAQEYTCTIRLDTRAVRFTQALRDVAAWWAAMPEYTPAHVPEEARLPLYSSWYVFHQNLKDVDVEEECRLAIQYGLKAIILDDGWQTADNHRGYSYCGDWEVCPSRFEDMGKHVQTVHDIGLKYVLWYAVPFIGVHCKNFEAMEGKYLFKFGENSVGVLDPRFPEVRDFLITLYTTAMKEWKLDGFKLDFIDSFKLGKEDPAAAQNYEGRDCQALSEGIDKLMVGIKESLQAINPDVMLEFRQSYIGPAMLKYGNMFRAGDCAGDYSTNRVRTIDIRLLAGHSAVHSDMLMWHPEDSVISAARQCWNILFSVPQISMKLGTLPADHQEMLRFFLNFWLEYRDVLLDGTLDVTAPELCYTSVTATKGNQSITAFYAPNQVFACLAKRGDEVIAVNASGKDGIVADLPVAPARIECFTVTGKPMELPLPTAGLVKIAVPDSGIVKMFF